MSLTIRQKLAACLFGILAVFIAAGGYEVRELSRELKILEQAKHDVARNLDKVVPLNLLVKDIRFHVVQVQQWLTDISATRGLDGLNDGFDVAKEHRAAFEKAAAEAKAIARDLELVSILKAIEAAEAAMPAYFQQGETMAKAYIAEGAESGNKLMGNFDKAAGAMTAAVDQINTQIEKFARDAAVDLNREMNQITEDTKGIVNAFFVAAGLALAVAIILAFYLFRVIREPIDKLLNDLG